MTRSTARLAMVATVFCSGVGWVAPAHAGGVVLTTPAALAPGDQFRFVFVTDGTTTARSTNITDYDNFVNTQAGGATYDGSVVTWQAIGSTAAADAIDHITGPSTAPAYLVTGTEVATSTQTTSGGLWSGSLLAPIDIDLSGIPVVTTVWTGTQTNGTGYYGRGLGGQSGYSVYGYSPAQDQDWTADNTSSQTFKNSFYGISQVFTVAPASVPEPSGLGMTVTAMLAFLAIGKWRQARGQRRQGDKECPPDPPQ